MRGESISDGTCRNIGDRRLLGCLGAAIGLLVPVAAHAADTASDPTVTIERKSVSPEAARESNRFKTRQGRLKAKPLDWNATIGTPEKRGEEAAPEERAAREPGTTKGKAPSPKARRDAQRLYPNEWRGIAKSPRAEQSSWMDTTHPGGAFMHVGTRDVLTQYCEDCLIPNTYYPEVAIGKLFSSAGTCSASVVSGNNVIVTAAHCCYDRSRKQWIGGWTFAPAYRNGYAPFGTYDWSSATVLTSWVNNGDIPSDVCLIRLQNDSRGRGITYYTGWLGRSWDWPSEQVHHALGYPGNLGNANELELCVSESFSPDSGCGGSGVLNTGCTMTYGSSGGPWIRNYRSDNWVNSVVHGYDSDSCTGAFGKTFNGARFTSGNIVTLCNAAGC